MLSKIEIDKTLTIISRAWGRNPKGYAFFPWIDREAQEKAGVRRAGYHEGPAFSWPQDRPKVVAHLYSKQMYDTYWCPMLFDAPHRQRGSALDEASLWADLDAVDPRRIEGYEPTIAWETSPGRYQALWILNSGDIQGAADMGGLNQRMTTFTGADPSGWDITQLLRIPGWNNHKPEYRDKDGLSVEGKLLWSNRRTYIEDDFDDLPEIETVHTQITDALTAEIEHIDRHKVIARIKLKLNKTARDLINARAASGDISGQLWYLTRCLADVGCSVAEIVAITKHSVWNKFAGRQNEIDTLIAEASKAIAKKSQPQEAEEIQEFDDDERPTLGRLSTLLANVKPPKFIVDRLITEGSCGFIGGEPKTFKSWVGLDLAISIATGSDFLDEFRVLEPGPVIYIQEEDPLPTLKTRTAKIWSGKAIDKMVLEEVDGMPTVFWLPAKDNTDFNPDINAIVQKQFTISDDAWMLWLDEELSKGMGGAGYKMVIMDTLMMTAGDVEENKSQEMTNKIFRPLKVMSRKHNVCVMLVHHLNKSEKTRPGQRLLGSVANHAWAEDSLYLSRPATGKRIRIDLESKSAPTGVWSLNNVEGSTDWAPSVEPWSREDADAEQEKKQIQRRNGNTGRRAAVRQRQGLDPKQHSTPIAELKLLADIEQLAQHGQLTIQQFADLMGVSYQTSRNRLQRVAKAGKARWNKDQHIYAAIL